MELPYKEDKISSYIKLRHFSEKTNPDDLKWHYDEEDRKINVIGETDWKFQFDNKLPMNMDCDIIIPKGIIHRIIKGSGDLQILIQTISLKE